MVNLEPIVRMLARIHIGTEFVRRRSINESAEIRALLY